MGSFDGDILLAAAQPDPDVESIDIADDEDVRSPRSPRSPVYRPASLLSSNFPPFDSAKLLSNLRELPTLKAVAPTKRTLPPPPSDPLAWVWLCHLCRSRWPLGVTRRCLVDGHFYCSGETSQPNLKKKKKGRSCSSEFDYVGWKEWAVWKRKTLKTTSNPRIPKGCEKCLFPSQCRYGSVERESIDDHPSSTPMAGIEYTSTTAEVDVARYYSTETVTSASAVACPDVQVKSGEARTEGLDKADVKRSKRSEANKSRATVAKIAERRSGKKPILSPIEEEALRNEVGSKIQDLVMPLVDLWAHTKAGNQKHHISSDPSQEPELG